VSKPDLTAGVGEVAEIPGDEIVDAVERGDGVVDGVGDEFAVKEAAVDVGFGEDGGFVGEVELVEGAEQIEITGAMRLAHALEFAPHQYRAKGRVFAHFVFPPADREVAAKRFVVVEIGAEDGGFDVEAELHFDVVSALTLCGLLQ